jgi:hypothetical protein
MIDVVYAQPYPDRSVANRALVTAACSQRRLPARPNNERPNDEEFSNRSAQRNFSP